MNAPTCLMLFAIATLSASSSPPSSSRANSPRVIPQVPLYHDKSCQEFEYNLESGELSVTLCLFYWYADGVSTTIFLNPGQKLSITYDERSQKLFFSAIAEWGYVGFGIPGIPAWPACFPVPEDNWVFGISYDTNGSCIPANSFNVFFLDKP